MFRSFHQKIFRSNRSFPVSYVAADEAAGEASERMIRLYLAAVFERTIQPERSDFAFDGRLLYKLKEIGRERIEPTGHYGGPNRETERDTFYLNRLPSQ